MSNQSKRPTQKKPNLLAGLEPAGWGRRIAALFIDWGVSTLVLLAIIGPERYGKPGAGGWVIVILFVEIVLFTVLMGGSFGQIVLKLRVRRIDGASLSPWAILIRTLLLVLVIPPLIYKPDGRGLHDMAVDSAAYHLI